MELYLSAFLVISACGLSFYIGKEIAYLRMAYYLEELIRNQKRK